MTLLPYVIAFLMVLSAITYSRIESMRTIVPSTIAFRDCVESIQKIKQEKAWEEAYKSIVVNEGSKDDDEGYSTKGSSKLNLKPLFAGTAANAEKKQAYEQMLTRLIYLLHRDAPYFKLALEENPLWVEHLIQEFGKFQAKKLKTLNEIEIVDPCLNLAFYHLMKGENSLAYYCTFAPQENISVYLASKQLLLAIFQDERAVEDIQQERVRISKEIRRVNADAQALKDQFVSLKSKYPTPFDAYLSYEISKTRFE